VEVCVVINNPPVAPESRVVELLEAVVIELRGLRSCLDAEHAASSSPLLTPDQLADLLQIDRRTLRRFEIAGVIPRAISLGGAKRWRRAEVERFLNKAKES
jgi:predicted DNA-binding transcriptional regulator AlpA